MKRLILFGFGFSIIISVVLNYLLIHNLIIHDWNWMLLNWFPLPFLKEIFITYYISVHLYILLVINVAINKKITL